MHNEEQKTNEPMETASDQVGPAPGGEDMSGGQQPNGKMLKVLKWLIGFVIMGAVGYGNYYLKTSTNISKCVSDLKLNYARSGYEKGFVSILFEDKITKEKAENILDKINPEHSLLEYIPGYLVELRVTKGSELDWKCNLENNNNVKVVTLSILPL